MRRLLSRLTLPALLVAGFFVWQQFGDQIARLWSNQGDDPAVHAAVQRYKAAQRSGDTSAMCREADHVARAYQQAGDDDSFHRWLLIENRDCGN